MACSNSSYLSHTVLDFHISSEDVIPGRGLLKLLQAEKHTDVSFLVEESVFKAHRVVMASQSEYFEKLLYGSMMEAGSSEVKLEDTDPGAFKALLYYMYSGTVAKLDLQTALELLALADRYNFPDLKASLQTSFCAILDLSNVLQFFFYSLFYNASKLHQLCADFVDNSAEGILRGSTILDLPKENFKVLLSRDTFVVDEIEVFHAVMRWKEYKNFSKKEVEDLLGCVRLSEISYDDLVALVESSGLFSKRTIYDAVQAQRNRSMDKMSPRGKIGLNLFKDDTTYLNDSCNYEVIISPSKQDSQAPLPCDFSFNLILRASIEPSCIVFEFNNVYLINQIQLEGQPSGHNRAGEVAKPFCYRIEVSKNGLHWMTVVDHSKCKCYLLQDLYFPKQAVKYVRLVQTRGHDDCTFRFIGCSYTGSDSPFRYMNGILAPLSSMSPAVIKHVVVEVTGIRCFLMFHQPYSISLLRDCLRFSLLQNGIVIGFVQQKEYTTWWPPRSATLFT